MKKHLILTLILTLALCICGTAFAQESYNITFTDGLSHHDKGTTWSADIVLPNVSGMADAEEQKALNDYFQQALDATVASYEEDVAYVNENYPDGNGPHFSCDVNYEVVTDSDDYIVLKVWMFYAAGDSATFNQYWVFSKHTGKEVPMTDVITAEVSPPRRSRSARRWKRRTRPRKPCIGWMTNPLTPRWTTLTPPGIGISTTTATW